MAYKYNPPTGRMCSFCENIDTRKLTPIIDSHNGKASSANNFKIHRWYNFVLGYSPDFPDYIIQKEGITNNHFVVDPFMGTGTTLVCCKEKNIPCAGIDANDYFAFVGKVKLNWNINIYDLEKAKNELINIVEKEYKKFNWNIDTNNFNNISNLLDPHHYANQNRYEGLTERYLSNLPFTKLDIIKKIIENYNFSNEEIKDVFKFALSAIIVPVSNIKYGPGFGIGKNKIDEDILFKYRNKIDQIIIDMQDMQRKIFNKHQIFHGDSREISKHFLKNSVDFLITSPPYPGDHEYTKHTKLELLFLEMANSLAEFQKIKKRMIRGSTTNIYKDDKDAEYVTNFTSIKNIVHEIERRLIEDNASSGFEKLYTKLVKEYFGGMYRVLAEAYKILKPGGKFILLVSDSHAFKMVHIHTANILIEIANNIGYINCYKELWQFKDSTSHKYKFFEDIVTLQKPLVE